jgi:hypothetical protein
MPALYRQRFPHSIDQCERAATEALTSGQARRLRLALDETESAWGASVGRDTTGGVDHPGGSGGVVIRAEGGPARRGKDRDLLRHAKDARELSAVVSHEPWNFVPLSAVTVSNLAPQLLMRLIALQLSAPAVRSASFPMSTSPVLRSTRVKALSLLPAPITVTASQWPASTCLVSEEASSFSFRRKAW